MAEIIIGTNGSGSANITPEVFFDGILEGVSATYKAGMPSGTVITIAEFDGLKRTLLTVTGNTNFKKSPESAVVDASGASIAGASKPFVVRGRLTITVANGSNSVADAVTLVIEVV